MAFKGDMNMRGYYKEPEITKEALENGNIYTNDLGYVGDDGLVYLLGRKGDVINMGGLKIAPTEIEEVVVTHEKSKIAHVFLLKMKLQVKHQNFLS